jgi:head-tail adaptor
VLLRRRLVLEAQVAVPDGAGGFAASWVPRGHLWAEVVPGAGRADGAEEFPVARQPFRITVRGAAPGAASRPVAGQRFRDGTRVFAILAVTERDTDGRYLVCAAVEEEPA